jgi:hypothetical protein
MGQSHRVGGLSGEKEPVKRVWLKRREPKSLGRRTDIRTGEMNKAELVSGRER